MLDIRFFPISALAMEKPALSIANPTIIPGLL
jgi:hypothetical protein